MSGSGASGIVFRSKVVVVSLPATPQSSGRRRRAAFLCVSMLVATAMTAMTGIAAPAAFAQKAKKPVGVRCDGSNGWAVATGVPASLAGNGPLGLYVWNQKGVWRITATGPERKLHTFQGTVSFDAAVATKSFGLEGRSDAVATSGSTVSFRFRNFGQRDGIGVEAPCATTVTIAATMDGVALAPTQVFIGAAAAAAPSVPVVLRKDSASAGAPTGAPVETVASACPTTAWASNSVGRPSGLKRAKGRTLHVWFENGTWQFVAANDAGRAQVLEGRVTFNAPVTVTATGLETADDLRVEPRFDGSSVVFSFRTGALSDGFRVASPCASQLTIELFADGAALPTSSLLVGPGAAPATAMPFVISR